MRRAIRIQPYLPPDLFQKLGAYAAARSQTVTAVIAAATRRHARVAALRGSVCYPFGTHPSDRPPTADPPPKNWKGFSRV